MLEQKQDDDATDVALPQEEQVEPELELTEHEQAVKAYLEEDEPLPPETLEVLIGRFWRQEPWASKGFILEGFPANAEQAEWMIEQNYYPEMIIFMDAEIENCVERVLPKRLHKWRLKRARKRENKMIKKEFSQQVKERKKANRRNELAEEYALVLEQRKKDANEKKKMKAAQVDDENEEGEEEEEDEIPEAPDIEAIIDEEFPEDEDEEEEEEEDEDPEEAEERIRGEIEESCQNEADNCGELEEIFSEAKVPRIRVSAEGSITRVRCKFVNKLNTKIINREALLSRVYPITWATAIRLIDRQYFPMSKFGHWCPVTLKENINPYPMTPELPKELFKSKRRLLEAFPGEMFNNHILKKDKSQRVVYNDQIYCLRNPNALKKFMKNPSKYVQEPIRLPELPLKVAVIGPPKSGKTTVSTRIAKTYGIVRMTPQMAIEWLLKSQRSSTLTLVKQLKAQLYRGEPLSEDMVASVMALAMSTRYCRTRGWVLDGYPKTAEEWECLRVRNINPFVVIDLDAGVALKNEELIGRGMQEFNDAFEEERMRLQMAMMPAGGEDDEEEVPEDNPANKIYDPIQKFNFLRPHEEYEHDLAIMFATYYEAKPGAYAWLDERQGLRVNIDPMKSKWTIWELVSKLISHRQTFIQHYIKDTIEQRPAQIGELGILTQDFEDNLGCYQYYCPVSLCLNDERIDTKNENFSDLFFDIHPDIRIHSKFRFSCEYKKKYYVFAGKEEMEMFIANPDIFLPPQAKRELPKKFPERLSHKQKLEIRCLYPWPDIVELKGYCPVCFANGKEQYESLILTDLEWLARYDDKIYAFCGNNCLVKFLRNPDKYSNLKLPYKLPPVRCNWDVTKLDLPGYLEQNIAEILRMALSACGQIKPKYPFINAEKSALILIALYLRAFNPNFVHHLRTKNRIKYEKFKSYCHVIVKLMNLMPMNYEETKELSSTLTNALDRFIELRKPDFIHPWNDLF